MIDFWLWVGLLLLVALSFVLIPVLFVRRAQSEEDRTAFTWRCIRNAWRSYSFSKGTE